ncbi:MAG TPA: hypothetical protein VNX28_01065, partial [Gemmataceae bacterium]|nr:hypothetical protein [Gemmataceae bacterium]
MFLLLMLGAAVSAPPPAPVAVVLEAAKGATVQSGDDKPVPARAMLRLYPSDRIKPNDQGDVVVVFFTNGRRERIKAGGRATVQAEQCDPPGIVEKLADVQQKTITRGLKTLGDGERGAFKLFRTSGEDNPPVVTPIAEARVLTDHPDLSWAKAPEARQYV